MSTEEEGAIDHEKLYEGTVNGITKQEKPILLYFPNTLEEAKL